MIILLFHHYLIFNMHSLTFPIPQWDTESSNAESKKTQTHTHRQNHGIVSLGSRQWRRRTDERRKKKKTKITADRLLIKITILCVFCVYTYIYIYATCDTCSHGHGFAAALSRILSHILFYSKFIHFENVNKKKSHIFLYNCWKCSVARFVVAAISITFWYTHICISFCWLQ